MANATSQFDFLTHHYYDYSFRKNPAFTTCIHSYLNYPSHFNYCINNIRNISTQQTYTIFVSWHLHEDVIYMKNIYRWTEHILGLMIDLKIITLDNGSKIAIIQNNGCRITDIATPYDMIKIGQSALPLICPIIWEMNQQKSMQYILTRDTLEYLKKVFYENGITLYTHREYKNKFIKQKVHILQNWLCSDIARKIVYEHMCT